MNDYEPFSNFLAVLPSIQWTSSPLSLWGLALHKKQSHTYYAYLLTYFPIDLACLDKLVKIGYN